MLCITINLFLIELKIGTLVPVLNIEREFELNYF